MSEPIDTAHGPVTQPPITPQRPEKTPPPETKSTRTTSRRLEGKVLDIALVLAKIFGGRIGWNQSKTLYDLNKALKDVIQPKQESVQANALQGHYKEISKLPLAEQIRFLRMAYTLLRKEAPQVFVDIYKQMSPDARIGAFSVSERDHIATSMMRAWYPLSHFEQFTFNSGLTFLPTRENYECFSLQRKVEYFEFYLNLPVEKNTLAETQLSVLVTSLLAKERKHFEKLAAKMLDELGDSSELKKERLEAFRNMLGQT